MKRKDRAWAVLKGSPDERAGGNDSEGSMFKELRRLLMRGVSELQSKQNKRQHDKTIGSVSPRCA